MLLGSFELLTRDPILTGVFVGGSVLVIAIITLIIKKNAKIRSGGGSAAPLFSSIPELNKAIEFTGFGTRGTDILFPYVSVAKGLILPVL